MVKSKHPADRAERRRLSEKKDNKRSSIKGVSPKSTRTISPDAEAE